MSTKNNSPIDHYVILDFINYDINSEEFISPTDNLIKNKNKFAIINNNINTKLLNSFNLDPKELDEYSYIIDYNKFVNNLIKTVPKIKDINNDNPVIKQLKLISHSKIYEMVDLLKNLRILLIIYFVNITNF